MQKKIKSWKTERLALLCILRRPCLDLLFVYCMIFIVLVVVYSLVKDRRDTQLPIGIVISCSLMNITKLIWI